MKPSLARSQAGFTYIAALFLVVVMGIMLGLTGQSWRMMMKREREQELLWRGMQYARAIAYYQYAISKKNPAASGKLTDIKSLRDGISGSNLFSASLIQKYLRELYDDPITGKEFELIKDPLYGIVGVKSTSDEEPLRQTNFEDLFDFSLDPDPIKQNLKLVVEKFKDKKKYSDWEFRFRPENAGTVNLNTPPPTLQPGG